LTVASGPNGSLPHHENGSRAIAAGDLIVLDGGALCQGYASDITRTVAVGTPSAEAREVYELVKRANAAGRAYGHVGATGHAIDAAARAVIEAGGYGPQFLHRTGHGLGLEIHEPPFIAVGERDPLPIGVTFTVEPGIYLNGKFGVRIEDMVTLTANGAETLTTLDRDLIVLPTT
jgi:Xaa-Pro aminopeptidase